MGGGAVPGVLKLALTKRIHQSEANQSPSVQPHPMFIRPKIIFSLSNPTLSFKSPRNFHIDLRMSENDED
jgi:hypothetical protein